MILGPYRNPPYRNPSTPKTSLSPPPNGNNHIRNPSPKRKLQDDSPISGSGQSLQIDTARISHASPLAHPDSPRSHVANRLKDLAIKQAQPQPATYEVPSSSQSPRKKLKRNPHIRELQGDVQSRQLIETPRPRPPPPPLEIPDSVSDNSTLFLEFGETADADADAYARLPSTPLSRGDGDDMIEAFDIVLLSSQKSSPTRNKRMLSPPPPPPPSQVVQSPDDQDDKISSLTWQDSEITGHEINSPDDDGEGINGIGFRPTAAIAYARSQARRQQVEGWKAREAREARQRRMDRRRKPTRGRGASVSMDGVSDGVLSDEESGRRTVRFAA